MYTHVHFPVMKFCGGGRGGGGGGEEDQMSYLFFFNHFVWPIMQPLKCNALSMLTDPYVFFLCLFVPMEHSRNGQIMAWSSTGSRPWTLTPHLSPISGADLRSSMHTGRGTKASTSTARLGGGGVPLPLCAI